MYNVLLRKASYDLIKNSNQRVFEVDILDLKKISGVSEEGYSIIEQNLQKLMNITIEKSYGKNHWAMFTLISSVVRKHNKLIFEFSYLITDALLENNYYTTLNLLIIQTLKSKYSVALYEILMRYKKINIPKFEIENLKKLLGADNYTIYRDFRRQALEKAIKEINDKTELFVNYEPIKRGQKVIAIQFNLEAKDTQLEKQLEKENLFKTFTNIEPQKKNKWTIKREKQLKEIDNIIEKIPERFKSKDLRLELLEFIHEYDCEYISAQVEYVKLQNLGHAKGFLGYLTKAIYINFAKAKNTKG